MEQDNTLLTPGEEKEVATPAEVEQTQEQTPEMVEDTERTETPAVDTSKFSTRELLDYLSEMVNREELPELQDMKRLKRMINHQEPVATDEAELDETEENGEEKNEEGDDMMILFINLRSRYHELQAKKDEEEKAEREDNYKRKLELISRLEANLESTDDFFKVRNEFENIRNEWKNIGRDRTFGNPRLLSQQAYASIKGAHR